MSQEIKVLRSVDECLSRAGIPYMLTGAFAMAFHAGAPRTTRDLDFVVALQAQDADRIFDVFSGRFHIDIDEVRAAVKSQRMFNLVHWETSIKVDIIVRKQEEYRLLEFDRRVQMKVMDEDQQIEVWVASREDLVLSKLIWARDSGSELQRRDVKALLSSKLDRAYVDNWAAKLGVTALLKEIDS